LSAARFPLILSNRPCKSLPSKCKRHGKEQITSIDGQLEELTEDKIMFRPRRVVRRRVVGRSLLGAAATTAVVVGTAGAISGRQQRKTMQQQAALQQQSAEQQQLADLQANQAAMAQQQAMLAQQQAMQPQQVVIPQAPAAAPAAGPDLMAQLQQLAQLHDSGVLTDEEFAAAKQKLLI
jgi:hypothetical protein